jgi:hypothetical protein
VEQDGDIVKTGIGLRRLWCSELHIPVIRSETAGVEALFLGMVIMLLDGRTKASIRESHELAHIGAFGRLIPNTAHENTSYSPRPNPTYNALVKQQPIKGARK